MLELRKTNIIHSKSIVQKEVIKSDLFKFMRVVQSWGFNSEESYIITIAGLKFSYTLGKKTEEYLKLLKAACEEVSFQVLNKEVDYDFITKIIIKDEGKDTILAYIRSQTGMDKEMDYSQLPTNLNITRYRYESGLNIFNILRNKIHMWSSEVGKLMSIKEPKEIRKYLENEITSTLKDIGVSNKTTIEFLLDNCYFGLYNIIEDDFLNSFDYLVDVNILRTTDDRLARWKNKGYVCYPDGTRSDMVINGLKPGTIYYIDPILLHYRKIMLKMDAIFDKVIVNCLEINIPINIWYYYISLLLKDYLKSYKGLESDNCREFLHKIIISRLRELYYRDTEIELVDMGINLAKAKSYINSWNKERINSEPKLDGGLLTFLELRGLYRELKNGIEEQRKEKGLTSDEYFKLGNSETVPSIKFNLDTSDLRTLIPIGDRKEAVLDLVNNLYELFKEFHNEFK